MMSQPCEGGITDVGRQFKYSLSESSWQERPDKMGRDGDFAEMSVFAIQAWWEGLQKAQGWYIK